MNILEKKVKTKLKFKQINMSDLIKTMSKLRPTNSSTADFISVKNVKQAADPLYPLLLNLINSTIAEQIYPKNTNIQKIKPVPKTTITP